MRCTSGGSETQGWPTLIAGDGSTHHPRPDGHLELRDVDVEVLREQLLQDSVQEALEHLASTENATASYTTLAVGVLCGGARGDYLEHLLEELHYPYSKSYHREAPEDSDGGGELKLAVRDVQDYYAHYAFTLLV